MILQRSDNPQNSVRLFLTFIKSLKNTVRVVLAVAGLKNPEESPNTTGQDAP